MVVREGRSEGIAGRIWMGGLGLGGGGGGGLDISFVFFFLF